MLSDDVLLEIFDFYTPPVYFSNKWITLVHVCRRWRSVVLQSPLRLNLQLVCSIKTRVRETLDIWPPLPLIIYCNRSDHWIGTPGMDNIIAALEHNDRICQISLKISSSAVMGYITNSVPMQKPFLGLTNLLIRSKFGRPGAILPDSFLGGTAPSLRSLQLDCIPFPGLPKLLLSATHLVNLKFHEIPISGYIPPVTMATALSALTNLELFYLHFQHPQPRPALGGRRLPPPSLTRSILPSLTEIRFRGTSEYLEEVLARVDAPRLNKLRITFLNQLIFDTPQLFQLISRIPTLMALDEGDIVITDRENSVKFTSQTSDYGALSVSVPCTTQLSALKQVCTSSLPFLPTLKDLHILEPLLGQPRRQQDVENTLWLEVLRPFSAVKNLYLSKEYVPCIAPALQELVGGRATEVLPTLENILLEGFEPSEPLHEGIEKFVAARRLTNHPVAVSRWDRDMSRDWESIINREIYRW